MKKDKKPFEFYIITVLFSVLILVCFLQVLFRFVLNLPLAWTEELSRYLFIALVYMGASAATIDDKHVRVELIDSILPPKVKRVVDITVRVLCAAICLVMAYNIKDMVGNSFRAHQTSAALQMPMGMMYLLVGLMFITIAVRFLQKAWRLSREGKGTAT